MIQKICGKIDNVSEETVSLELSGIFYEVLIPSGLAESLRSMSREGRPVTLYT